jgi:hypothetical protein
MGIISEQSRIGWEKADKVLGIEKSLMTNIYKKGYRQQ